MDNSARYMELVMQSRDANAALRGLQSVRPSENKLVNPEEADNDSMEWLDMLNHYTNRLNKIMEEMEELEARLPPVDVCPVHQLADGAGLCATASRYSAPAGGNGCQFCLRDQVTVADNKEE